MHIQTSTATSGPSRQAGLDFEQRLQSLRKRIYNMAYRNLRNTDDAEDVTQETFIRAWSHYDRFDAGRSFDSWVARIAINLCIDKARRRQRQRTVSLDTPPAWAPDSEPEGHQVTDSKQDPATRLMESEVEETLQRTLHTLPASYRTCVQLLEQEHSYEEISSLLGCPLGTVRSRVHRARAMIRKRLETR